MKKPPRRAACVSDAHRRRAGFQLVGEIVDESAAGGKSRCRTCMSHASVVDDHIDSVREFQPEFARASDPYIQQQPLHLLDHLLVALGLIGWVVMHVGDERLTRIDKQPDCAGA